MRNSNINLFDVLDEFKTNKLKDKDIDSDDLEIQLKIYTIERYHENSKSRKELTKWVKWIVSIYLVLIFFILLLNSKFIFLSDIVLCTLLGTTTLNILGLMYIVLKGYFNIEE